MGSSRIEERYTRLFPALTEDEHARLRSSRACIVGCGGLGGYLLEFLARLGVGHITMIDGDSFEESNLNRQILCTADNIGEAKVQAAAKRVAEINPEVELSCIDEFLDSDNCTRLLGGHDVILDALDGLDARLTLADACESLGIPLVHGAVQGWHVQVALAMPGDGLIRRLYPEEMARTDKSCLPFTPPFCAALQAAEATKLLCGREPALTGKLLVADLLTFETQIIEI